MNWTQRFLRWVYPSGSVIARVQTSVKITGAEGLTCDELAAKWGMHQNDLAARFSALRDQGMIKDSGEKRKSRKGKACIVWVATHVKCVAVTR